jgi:hypothetical protein
LNSIKIGEIREVRVSMNQFLHGVPMSLERTSLLLRPTVGKCIGIGDLETNVVTRRSLDPYFREIKQSWWEYPGRSFKKKAIVTSGACGETVPKSPSNRISCAAMDVGIPSGQHWTEMASESLPATAVHAFRYSLTTKQKTNESLAGLISRQPPRNRLVCFRTHRIP